MPLPHAPDPDEQQLVRYLLGLLPEEETERLDELTMVDDKIAWRLRAAENDLVDSYLMGKLSAEMLDRFESLYLASPRRRQKVEFAAGFLRAVDRVTVPAEADPATEPVPEPAAEQDVAPLRVSGSFGQTVPHLKAAWILAAAAALFLCASGALFVRNIQIARELNQSQQERAALSRRASDLEQQLADQQKSHADVVSELERTRAAQTGGTPRAASENVSDSSASAPLTTIALALSPLTRSAAPAATLVIPDGTDRVAFELRLETNEFSHYRVLLRDPATGLVVWRSGDLKAPPTSDSPTISLVVPAGLLKTQHYSLELVGRRAGGTDEVTASYAFRAVHP